MNKCNILFTGAGRRVELMQAFRQAALELDIDLKIYGADMLGNAPALSYCDYTRIVCSMRDDGYIDELIQICTNDKISLLIPTIDTDLLVLSQNKDRFELIGTKVLISSPDKIAICRDKNLTAKFFEKCGLKVPFTTNNYLNYSGSYPCFIKPKDGSSSINAFKVNCESELIVYSNLIDEYIVQPYIEGTEYTVDIFCDYEGNPITIIPRVRMSVRAGEVLKTKIELDSTIIDECKCLIEEFKPCGPMTVQLIRQKKSNVNYYIEINPRFGGGSTLSMKAGSRSAENVFNILHNNKIEEGNKNVCDGAVYSRFDQSVCVDNGKSTTSIKGVIFDLDDTLYCEKDYVKSGFKAVESFLKIDGASDMLWKFFLEKKSAIDELLKVYDMEYRKKECLDIYRNHIPEIKLSEGALDLIKKLKDNNIKVGIITDGRVQGQKNKIEALGLNDIIDDIIITDELGGEQFRKPCDIAFRIMQRRWKLPFENLIYIGDNVRKDFQAPMQLGMQSILIKNQEGFYFNNANRLDIKSCDTYNDIINNIIKI